MTLKSLVAGLQVKEACGPLEAVVEGISCDSRRAGRGDVFVCVKGENADGRSFAADALKRGAVAIIAEEAVPCAGGVPVVIVESARKALAAAAVLVHGCPSARMSICGVTGTNGKTTVAMLSRAVLEAGGYRAGLVGTIEYRWAGVRVRAVRTTPEAPELQGLLSGMLAAGCDSAVIEVSSHALEQYRVDGTEFSEAVFTNVSQDHLDFHGTLERYSAAKARLFSLLAAGSRDGRTAVVNADDPRGGSMVRAAGGAGRGVRVLLYGLGPGAEVTARDVAAHRTGVRFVLAAPGVETAVELGLRGTGNVLNALAAASVGLARGLGPAESRKGLESVRGVRGRFETVHWGGPFEVVIDYAHTPAAMEFALSAARELGPGRVITVFGCGGDRDAGKRPRMGAVAARLSDVTVLTSDNPRSEPPGDILARVEQGYRQERTSGYCVVEDRREAIRAGLAEAAPGDLVLICGKGHETEQVMSDGPHPFDDREVALELLREMGNGRGGQ